MGMGMDPMAMQSMYMNGGFNPQGMGMGGFGGGYGSGSNNWNGQQSWNFGQDNYNSASAAGMGSGDFGAYNSGFQPGYNQGAYGHNDYRRNANNNFGFRGRGRGRGFYGGQGRGGYQQVIVRISAEVTVPHADRPFDGIFQLATELSPMASPHFEPGKPTDTEMLLSRLLEKTIRRSGALDMESLCLVAGAKVWSVRADVHVVSHDGNIVDAACLAAVAALRH
ncbi:hypothetical protein BN1708_017786, partial [Verticillium longisporum]